MYQLIAGTTHMPGGTLDANGSTRWRRIVRHPATMRRTNLRVVLGSDGRTVVTAFLE
jgi:hypothetical protein